MVGEFATIIGLISAFISGRKLEEQIELSEFLVWLSDHNHDEIRSVIESSHATSISIKALLNRGLSDINQKLDAISGQIATLSSRNIALKELAATFARESISEQSIKILALMRDNQSEFFLVSKTISSKEKRLVLAPGPNHICNEPQFLEDDLVQMTSLGLLVQKSNSQGEPMYCFTRAASKLLESLA
jgi:hypothetical protein